MSRYDDQMFIVTGIVILTNELFIMIRVRVTLNWWSAAFITNWYYAWLSRVILVRVLWMYMVVYQYQFYYLVLVLYCQLL